MPVVLYLFLQAFGKNKFTIPVFHQYGPEYQVSDCGEYGLVQYVVPHLFMDDLEKMPIVVYGLLEETMDENIQINIRSFIRSIDHPQKLSIIVLAASDQAARIESYPNLVVYGQDEGSLAKYRCELLIPNTTSKSIFVLCDQKRHVRGYYDLSDLEEMDRLTTETQILFEEQHDE